MSCDDREDKMVKQYFTFGCGHEHEGGYVIIQGKSIQHCREVMFREYGDKWFTNYDSAEDAGVDRYNLYLVEHIILND